MNTSEQKQNVPGKNFVLPRKKIMKTSEKRILGIDPGYDRCGVAIVTGKMQAPKIVFSCCIETDRKKTFPERLHFIFKCLSDIIEEHKPTHLSIEDIFFATNQKTVIKVAEARGVCLLAAALFGLDIAEYTPLQIKTYLTSYGRADKKQVHFVVKKILEKNNPEFFAPKTSSHPATRSRGESKILDDEIDALAIALTHLFVAK